MKLFKKKKSQFYWYDFVVAGKRHRGSTKERNEKRAEKIAALKLSKAVEGHDPLPRRAPLLSHYSVRFFEWLEHAPLEMKTKTYYQTGWRLLRNTRIAEMRLDQITPDDIGALRFDHSPATANCALRTLRRMLHKAEEWKLFYGVPKFKLVKEHGRSLRLDEEAEKKLAAGAAKCKSWRKRTMKLFTDVIILMRDTGMRNERELYRMRIENIDWANKVIFVPDSKTPSGRRMVLMSDRVVPILKSRCEGRSEGWVFPSQKSRVGHLTNLGKHFRQAREKAGLPKDLGMYCGRHDYGTRVLRDTGNLAAVMKTMGHRDVRMTMNHQHPELEIVRAALNRPQNQPTNQ